jgi:hypothetical protein
MPGFRIMENQGNNESGHIRICLCFPYRLWPSYLPSAGEFRTEEVFRAEAGDGFGSIVCSLPMGFRFEMVSGEALFEKIEGLFRGVSELK